MDNKLIQALISVESKGDDFAIGDRHLKNKAYGCLQIRKPYVDDVNRVFGTKYIAQECLGNRALSISLLKRYMTIYATAKRLGRAVTAQDIARIHNGGPNGWRRAATLVYWNRVRRLL